MLLSPTNSEWKIPGGAAFEQAGRYRMIVEAVLTKGPKKPRKQAKRSKAQQHQPELDSRVGSTEFVWDYQPDDVETLRVKVCTQ